MHGNIIETPVSWYQVAWWRRRLLAVVTAIVPTVAAGGDLVLTGRAPPIESSGTSAHEEQGDNAQAGRAASPGLSQADGAFAKLWNQQWFIGPRVYTFAKSRSAPQRCLPGDFEQHGAIVVGGGWLAREAPEVLGQIVRRTQPRELLILLISSARERDAASRVLAGHGVRPETVHFLAVPTDTGWVRDFGPIFVREETGAVRAVDATYGGPKRQRDDAAAQTIAERFGMSATTTRLRWQGGNLLSNGQGLIVTTTQSINENIECGFDADTVADFMERRFGAAEVVVLEHFVGEPTAHVDMFAAFTCPNTIVVGRYDRSVDAQNAAVLDRNAARLAKIRTREGRLKVVRIPMPSNQDGAWRSFTNVVFANGTLLVPIYPDTDPAAGAEALDIFRRLLPEWKVVGLDAGTMARRQGGLRCVTLYVPEACRHH